MTPTAALAARVLEGEPRAIARAISLAEDESERSAELIRHIYARTGRAYTIGITGPPGAGKSTLVDRLTSEIRRAGRTVGIIAVDPTSPFSGGAILGDRIRMSGHYGDPGVYIRSMATRGHLGGLARATADVALILDAAGKDVIVIETVGVGQDEVDIVRTADVSVVVLVPGTGDDVQALKAGIMEIADIFVVNKADREGADQLVRAITAAIALQAYGSGEWRPPVLKTIASDGTGMAEVWSTIGTFRAQSSDRGATRERERQEHRVRDLLGRRLVERVERSLPVGELSRIVDDVAARVTDPYSAVGRILEQTFGTEASLQEPPVR